MKKIMMAGVGVAALGLAALPTVGVFAATSSVTDTLEVTINKACTIRNDKTTVDGGTGVPTTNNQYSVTMSNGQLRSDIGSGATGVTGENDSTIDISCNTTASDGGSWSLTAAGKEGSNTLSAGGSTTPIASGPATEGATSNWAFKVSGVAAQGGTFTPVDDYNNKFAAVPASSTKIAEGSGSATLTMLYQVYVSPTQATGSYTGGVVYTLTNPAS